MQPLAECSHGIHAAPHDNTLTERGLQHRLARSQSCAGFSKGTTHGWLVALTGIHRGEDFRLLHGGNVVGSAFLADVVLTGLDISGRHALISCLEDGCEIEDLSSHGGTMVNGRCMERGTLCDGDEIKIGDVRLMFRLAKRFVAGYRPIFRERPVGDLAASVKKRSYVTGWLVMDRGDGGLLDFRLEQGKNIFGSRHGLHITLDLPEMGARHGYIECTKGQCFINHCAFSRHAIFVGEHKISGKTLLTDSVAIRLGHEEFYLKWF